jgi:hypothetical protein
VVSVANKRVQQVLITPVVQEPAGANGSGVK